MPISRDSFDSQKHYDKVVFQTGKPLVDAELNELQDIERSKMRKVVANALVGSPNNGFKIVGTGAANNFTIKAGDLFAKGFVCAKEADVAYVAQTDFSPPSLSTPVGNRTDIVYLHIFEAEINSAADNNLIDPTLGIETAIRKRLRFCVKVAEGGSLPADDATNWYYQLAVLNRTATANIDAGMVTESRTLIVPDVTDHGQLTGLADDDHTQYYNQARGDSRYALTSKGVTNGDTHDHVGGDGAQIAHGNLSGAGTNSHATIDTFIASKAQINGLASLDGAGKVPTGQLPSYVDDVLEYANLAAFPGTGETGKIYVALDTNKCYRWSGSVYVYITSGAVDSVAGKTGPVTLVKADVGLANVDNTSDVNKPVSTVQQTALNLKANLASPAFTGTVTGITKAMVGLGSADDTSDVNKPVSTAQQTALNLKANLASPTFTGTVSGITKAMVGLGNVDNTSDASKPVSSATQTALNLKANLAGADFTGNVTIAAAQSLAADTIVEKTLAAGVTVDGVLIKDGAIAKSAVGLSNVDNTSDANKPISSAAQTALNAKAPLASPAFTGTVTGITAAMVGAPAGSGNSTGTNTGDQTTITGNAGSASVAAALANTDAAGQSAQVAINAATVGQINWARVNKALSSIADLATKNHSDLSGIGTNSHATIDTHIGSTANPHSITKTHVGLANVTNDAQIAKSIGTAKGDVIGFTASAVPARVGVGLDGQVLTADAVSASGFKWATPASGVTDHGLLSGLADDDHSQYHNDARGDARYAPIAKGVTNGDTHNHVGGDGGQIAHGDLSGIGSNAHSVIDTHLGSTSNPHSTTKAQVGLTNVTDEAQIAKSIGTAKGDVIAFSASATPVRVAVGTDGQALVADAASTGGVKWAGAVEPGIVAYHAANSVPAGWLKCNAAAVSRTVYAALFAKIGTVYGVGDGSTTFNVPELRGEFIRAFDDARGADSGRVLGTPQDDRMQGHGHSLKSPYIGIFSYRTSGGAYTLMGGGTLADVGVNTIGVPSNDGSHGAPRVDAETRPRNVALLACIKY